MKGMDRGVRSRTAAGLLMALWYGGWVIAGIVLIQSATPWGIGIRHDSLPYLTAAQSLSRGECLCRVGSGLVLKPLTHFGPVYPTMISAVTLLGVDALGAARWIAAVLFGANIAVWGGMVHYTSRRFWAGAAVSAWLAISPVLLQIHDAAMSEPLFLLIAALAILTLTAYLVWGNRRNLYLAAGAVCLAVLTRYAAGSLVALGLVALLLLRDRPWKDRFSDAGRFALVSLGPVLLWFIHNDVVAGSATNRVLRWHPLTLDDVRASLRVVTAWFTPNTYSHWIEGAVLAGLILGLGVFLAKHRAPAKGAANPPATLGLVLVGFSALYPAYVAMASSLFDDTIPFDDRMFSPLYVALIASFGIVAAIVWKRPRGAWAVIPVAILTLVGPVPYMLRGFQAKRESMRTDGVLFASRVWTQSQSVAWVRQLPEDALVYSNQALVVQFLTGRPVYQIPERFDAVKAEARDDFEEAIARMRADLQRPDSYLVVLDPARPMTPEELEDEFKDGLSLFRSMTDGFVLWNPASEGTD